MPNFILAINDLFRVEAESWEEAEQILLENIGTDPFLVYDVERLEVEE